VVANIPKYFSLSHNHRLSYLCNLTLVLKY